VRKKKCNTNLNIVQERGGALQQLNYYPRSVGASPRRSILMDKPEEDDHDYDEAPGRTKRMF
jgi:hypothetical protein